jgi:adenine specific DNA methylase Mod
MATITKKDKFFEVLRNIFVGAKIEGNSGYVNLMKIKSKYYNEFKEKLLIDIDEKLNEVGKNFEDELYNKLFSFFKKYFSESGSIYFSYTPLQEKVYERIYRDDKDVALFWKTHMLYYVKTEKLFKNLEVEDEGVLYIFDVADLQHKKNNEKKELVFEFDKLENTDKRKISIKVKYSTHGAKTNTEAILKKIKTERAFNALTLKQIEKVLSIFKRQSEVDYFINKDANRFLKEQFSLWIKGYLLDDETLFESARLNQLKTLQKIAFNIVDLVSQFEDELVKIWNKPKYAHSSNYVITLDRIADNDMPLLEKILKHKGIKEQLKEWLELAIVNNDFDIKEVIEGKKLNNKWKFLPLDTKYVKDLECDILELFDDYENRLDGVLIKSDNYQALNSLRRKYSGQIQTIYIDPPYNTGTDFIFIDNYQDATWLSLMDNRIDVSKMLLKDDGSYYVQLDHIAEHYGKLILDKNLGKENYKAKITWNTGDNISGFKSQAMNWIRQADYIHFYSNSQNYKFYKIYELLDKQDIKLGWLDIIGKDKKNLFIEKWLNGELVKEKIDYKVKAKGTIWNDIFSFQYSEPRITESLSFVSNQKPENLLRRILQSSTDINDYVLDFFVGSGTTIAVAHKLKRKWIGVEMGDFFNEIYFDEVEVNKNGSTKFESDLDDSDDMELVTEDSSEFNEVLTLTDNTAIVKILSETKKKAKVLMKKIGTLGRMKIMVKGDKEFKAIHSPVIRKPHLSKDINWCGGGFFKYFSFEQYEDSLAKVKYEDKNSLPTQDIYHQYLFLKDLKLADDVIKLDEKTKKIKVDLTKLHNDIDIPETLSQLTGKFIKQIKKDRVIFVDGSEIEYDKIDYKIVKPLIWW